MLTDEPTVVIVMGVSGSGKTTVGRRLAERLGWPFYEGDDLHPEANVEKMSRGEPLDDKDRQPWLEAIRDLARRELRKGRSAVIACSALKRAYRDITREGRGAVQFIYLKGRFDLIRRRMRERREREDHFMPPELLKSQFDALQEPDDALVVDIAPPPETIVNQIQEELKL